MKHMWSEEEIQDLIEEQGGSGGSEVHLYVHTIWIYKADIAYISFNIYNTSQNALNATNTLDYLLQNTDNNNNLECNGNVVYNNVMYSALGVYVASSNPNIISVIYNRGDINTTANANISSRYNLFKDVVTQIF